MQQTPKNQKGEKAPPLPRSLCAQQLPTHTYAPRETTKGRDIRIIAGCFISPYLASVGASVFRALGALQPIEYMLCHQHLQAT
jgi:hypothetical protein